MRTRVRTFCTQTATIVAFCTILILFIFGRISYAEPGSCDNSKTNTKSSQIIRKNIHTWSPTTIESDPNLMKFLSENRLSGREIMTCLEKNKPIRNHIIDFRDYRKALERTYDKRARAMPKSEIRDSILWSFDGKRISISSLVGRVRMESRDSRRSDGPLADVGIDWRNSIFGPKVYAKSARFSSGVTFRGSKFPHNTDFRDAEFLKGANFNNATFTGKVRFRNAEFSNNATFGGAEFYDEVSFRNATFRKRAVFSRGRFHGESDFRKSVYKDRAHFNGAYFSREARFDQAQFSGTAHFKEVIFLDDSVFGDVKFQNDSQFSQVVVRGDARFRGAIFDQRANFESVRFLGNVWFSDVEFGKESDFSDTTFEDKATYDSGIFTGAVSFANATAFDLSFSNANFKDDASFQNITIAGLLDLSETQWMGWIDLRKANIETIGWITKGVFSPVSGPVVASGATIAGGKIANVYFEERLELSDSILGDMTRPMAFENVIFEKESDFSRATFLGSGTFVRNRFRNSWNLADSKFKDGATLCMAYNQFEHLRLDASHIGMDDSSLHRIVPMQISAPSLEGSIIRGVEGVDVDGNEYSCAGPRNKLEESLGTIYERIEAAYRRSGNRIGENEAWYLGMLSARELESEIRRLAEFILLDVPSRYGIDLYRVVSVSFAIVVVFAVVYAIYFANMVKRGCAGQIVLRQRETPTRAFRFRPVETFFPIETQNRRDIRIFVDAWCLSGRAFFKLGLGSGYPRTKFLIWVAMIEWTMGLYMLVHLLVAMKNSVPMVLFLLATSS